MKDSREMEFKKPKSKKRATDKRELILPLKNKNEAIGVFNGQNVTVHDWDSMNLLYYSGNFGKGSLSKGAPNYHAKKDDIPKIIFEQQFENQSKWISRICCSSPPKYRGCSSKNELELSLATINNLLESSFIENKESWKSWKEKHVTDSGNCKNSERCKHDFSYFEFKSDEITVDENLGNLVNEILKSKQTRKSNVVIPEPAETVIVLEADSSQNNLDKSLTNIDARLERLSYIPEENLNLNLEESLFLKSVLGCLKIVDLNFSELSVTDLWKKFNAVESNFIERYITYHYYRSNGWVVKSALKFGGDYLLYKDGPDYFHASYLVKVLDKRKKLSWREFIAMNRLVETFNKDLILINIIPVKTTAVKEAFPDKLKNYTVQEVLVRRWFPSKERFSKEDTAS